MARTKRTKPTIVPEPAPDFARKAKNVKAAALRLNTAIREASLVGLQVTVSLSDEFVDFEDVKFTEVDVRVTQDL